VGDETGDELDDLDEEGEEEDEEDDGLNDDDGVGDPGVGGGSNVDLRIRKREERGKKRSSEFELDDAKRSEREELSKTHGLAEDTV